MSAGASEGAFLSACAVVVRRMWTIFRSNWRLLLLAGLAIFVPLGLLETIDASITEAIDEAGAAGVLEVIELISIGGLHTIGSLLGEVLFAGIVTATVIVHHSEGGVSLRELLGGLSLWRLALADLAFVAIVVLGFIALILPGLFFLVWFALLGPVIKVEHLGVRDAFGRSREVVRRRPWLVAAFVLPITALDPTLTGLAHEASIGVFGETFIGEWGAGTLAELVTSLPLALAVVVLYFELSSNPSRDERRPSPGTRPQAIPRSRPEGHA